MAMSRLGVSDEGYHLVLATYIPIVALHSSGEYDIQGVHIARSHSQPLSPVTLSLRTNLPPRSPSGDSGEDTGLITDLGSVHYSGGRTNSVAADPLIADNGHVTAPNTVHNPVEIQSLSFHIGQDSHATGATQQAETAPNRDMPSGLQPVTLRSRATDRHSPQELENPLRR